ncbi:MAG: methylated-DNA--[protein]-cysteine S-methyltransferase [Pseudomonadales bacterium]|jgi:methylated-DNA-[protein]-cysteine S-methyltransferase|nr:methylated-DNA--[protein]-cysteine S-methyltransferase [Pseudomonadales bacterium]
MRFRYIDSPIGKLLLAGRNETLQIIGFPEGKGTIIPEENWDELDNCFVQVEDQLGEYFAGRRQVFALKLQPTGTPFQLQVLAALQAIPFGETRSYLDIARSIGRPKAVRAVGAANGRNPLPIVIPCHRVIGTNGSLTGFGGGLAAKEYLLNLESAGFGLTAPRG